MKPDMFLYMLPMVPLTMLLSGWIGRKLGGHDRLSAVQSDEVVEALRALNGRASPHMLCLTLMTVRGFSQEEAASAMGRCKAIKMDRRDGKLVLR
jgi:hypothetical protein